MSHSLRLLIGAALAAMVAVGCQTTPRLPGRDVDVLTPGSVLAERNPVDIVVAPVVTTEAARTAPTALLRRATRRALVRRRYSPLADDLVMEAIPRTIEASADLSGGSFTVEAGYVPGRLGEDAIFELNVYRWDASAWRVRNRVAVGIEGRMIDPNDPMGTPLWDGRLERTIDVSTQLTPAMVGDRALGVLCDEVMQELLARMPARSPEASLGLEGGAPRGVLGEDGQ